MRRQYQRALHACRISRALSSPLCGAGPRANRRQRPPKAASILGPSANLSPREGGTAPAPAAVTTPRLPHAPGAGSSERCEDRLRGPKTSFPPPDRRAQQYEARRTPVGPHSGADRAGWLLIRRDAAAIARRPRRRARRASGEPKTALRHDIMQTTRYDRGQRERRWPCNGQICHQMPEWQFRGTAAQAKIRNHPCAASNAQRQEEVSWQAGDQVHDGGASAVRSTAPSPHGFP